MLLLANFKSVIHQRKGVVFPWLATRKEYTYKGLTVKKKKKKRITKETRYLLPVEGSRVLTFQRVPLWMFIYFITLLNHTYMFYELLSTCIYNKSEEKENS